MSDRRNPLVATGILLTAIAGVLSAQSAVTNANPFLGSWKLNVERSNLPAPQPRDLISVRVFEDQGGGLMLHTIVSSDAEGARFLFAAVKYDGNEYPVYNSLSLGVLLNTGTKSPVMLTYTRVDAFTLEQGDLMSIPVEIEAVEGRAAALG